MTISNKHLNEFQLDESLIYLNHAAVAPWPKRTMDAVTEFARENLYRGAQHYPRWMQTEANLRNQLQLLLNAESTDTIALLKNTSEALSVVAYGLSWKPGNNIVTSTQEFPSNRIIWQSLENLGVELRQVKLDPQQSLIEDALIQACDHNTRLMTISSIQFDSGLRLDLEKLGGFCKSANILFCVDAIQSIGAITIDVQSINADFVMADGHKWMVGPEGLAVFYCKPEHAASLRLNQYGWHMVEDYLNFDKKDWEVATSARRYECGSPNMLGIHALQASLSLLLEIGLENIEIAVTERARLIMDLVNSNNNLQLLTPTGKERYGGIVSFKHHSIDSNTLHHALHECGVICAPRAGGVRFSPHFYTPQDQIHTAFEIINRI